MFVAPFVMSVPAAIRHESPLARVRPRAARRTGNAITAAPLFLLAWLAVGLVLLLCVPAARGNGLLGATLPFWLVGAPLLDLGWLWRVRLARALARACSSRPFRGRLADRAGRFR